MVSISLIIGFHLFCLLILLYPFFIYPLFLKFVSTKPIAQQFEQESRDWLLFISFLNQEKFLKDNVEQYLALLEHYPQLTCVFIDDGSSDKTLELLNSLNNTRVKVFHFEQAKGKNYRLRTIIPDYLSDSKRQLLFFSDGNTLINIDAFDKLARQLSLLQVGMAGGRLEYLEQEASEAGYWNFENGLRQLESDFYSQVGACGAFFALKAELYSEQDDAWPIDFAYSLSCAIKGLRTSYVAGACIRESLDGISEGHRKVRTIVRGLFCLSAYIVPLLQNAGLRFNIALFSHKLIRWLMPFVFVVYLLSLVYLPFWGMKLVSVIFLSLFFRLFSMTYLWLMLRSCLKAQLMLLSGQKIRKW